ncbi:hypothetical protein HMI56_000094, partial [Coelomomyces lativittatus]
HTQLCYFYTQRPYINAIADRLLDFATKTNTTTTSISTTPSLPSSPSLSLSPSFWCPNLPYVEFMNHKSLCASFSTSSLPLPSTLHHLRKE